MRLGLGGSRGSGWFRIRQLGGGFGGGFGARGGRLRVILLKTAVLVFAARTAMARLVASR